MARPDSTLDDPPATHAVTRRAATLRVLFSAGTIREDTPVELPAGEVQVGRTVEPGGLLLDDPRVSRLHARLRVTASGGSVVIVNESQRGTEVNGAPVESIVLADGDVLTFGHTLALFRVEVRPGPDDAPLPGLLGSAPAMRAVRALIRRVAATDAVVTLLGETGSGKEVAARAIHACSGRSGPFVAVNCAAIPEALAESQLFGHVAGAFTGAQGAAEGFFRAAGNGTLFLDEVGELSAAVQAKLLRALETGAVAPVGTFREVPHSARVVTATHRDLAGEVAAGRFRRDLYARMIDFVVTLPPLRARREDVLPLLRHAYGPAMPPLDIALAKALVLHPWPFNVREVVRAAARLRAYSEPGAPLGLRDIEDSLRQARALVDAEADVGAADVSAALVSPDRARPPSREELEALLRTYNGVVSDVARAVGRSRKQVYRWIDGHAIDPEAFRKPE